VGHEAFTIQNVRSPNQAGYETFCRLVGELSRQLIFVAPEFSAETLRVWGWSGSGLHVLTTEAEVLDYRPREPLVLFHLENKAK
jgi:hypothetical protein